MLVLLLMSVRSIVIPLLSFLILVVCSLSPPHPISLPITFILKETFGFIVFLHYFYVFHSLISVLIFIIYFLLLTLGLLYFSSFLRWKLRSLILKLSVSLIWGFQCYKLSCKPCFSFPTHKKRNFDMLSFFFSQNAF